ncbi:lymphocyte antigen 75-like [Periplaneta americana]|uniref:lymphocyte antigen 75-like n=1 Tax=Periplaneta americana TaxID=6978 RepID=UPI0037E907D8
MLKRNTNAKSQLWIHSPTRPEHNCLNLYHPTSNRILFLDRKCNETFGFICESISPSISKIETRILKGRQYTFYSLKVNWNKANNICKSSGSYLAVVKTPDEAALITEFGEEFLDLWVGARITDSSRIWEHTKESVTNATDVYPYLPAQLTPHMDCVVIGRGQAGSAYLNDTLCNSNHNFVCEEQGDNGDTYVETYTFNNQQYILSTRKTSWSRAEWLCRLSGSHLAILNTKEEAEFFNNVSRKFHDLWIGGKQQDGKWIWNYTNEYIISGDSSADTYEPQFVNSSVKAKKDMCLNWYRESNKESYLIGRPCKEEYGFMCEGRPIGPTPKSQVADFNGRKYRLHDQLATWNDALEICSSLGGYLANVGDLEEAGNIIGVDEQFHDLWIGGHHYEDHWTWQNNEERIAPAVDNITSYPPWINSSTRPGHECLNLYSTNSEPKFVDRKCNEMHGFVCEEVGLKEDVKVVSKFSGHRYVFVAKRVKWHVALESCRAMRGYLAIISDSKELKFIVDGSRDFHDLWVGGHLVKGKWEWEHTGTQVLTPAIEVSSNSNVTKKEILPWLRFPTIPGQECLNVYRDNKNKPFLVDKKCSDLHAYICENVPETILSSRQVKYFQNRRYELFQDRVSWPEASSLCSLLGGYIAIIDSVEEASFLASASKDLSEPWIGAVRRYDGSWMWSHTEQGLPPNSSAVPPFVNAESRPLHECASLYRDSFNKPMLVDRRCGHRFGFICEDTNEPESAVEVFEYRGHYYVFNSKMVTWEEASRICNKNGSYLTIIESLEEAQFIVSVSKNIHDVWVDGWCNKNMWEWRHTGQHIASKAERVFPPWIHYPTRPDHNCLNIFRDSNSAPHFVDRKCSEKHVFICEEVDGSSKHHQEKFQYNGRTYLFSTEKVTWNKASEICEREGSYLAQVESSEEALFIIKAGRDFHDLWIGGRLSHENWEWDHTGQDIPKDSGPGSFPQWVRVNSRLEHDCLNIFRSSNLEPLFIDRKCNETHGYVCEEADNIDGGENTIETLVFDDHLFTFHAKRMTWSKAFDICADNDSTLPIITNKNVAQLLISKGYHDIWIGGKFEDTHWAWKPKNRPIVTKDEFPVLIDTIPRPEHDCLVLYRDNENRSIFLDRRCEEEHVFVCQKYNIVGEETENLEYGDRIFTFVRRPEEWGDAYDICSQNSSHLPMVIDECIQKFLADKVASVPEIWIGGHKSKEQWRWELLGETIRESKTDSSFPVWLDERVHSDRECLSLNIETNGQPKFASRECNSGKPFVCEKGCPTLKYVKRGKWSRPECNTRVSVYNETCSLTCKYGFELWGTKELTCGRDGWNGVPPLCITTDRLGNAFVERVNSSLSELLDFNNTKIRHTVLLFVISTTKNLGTGNFFNIVELIKSVVAAVRLSPSLLSAGVVTYGEKGEVSIPLDTSDVCVFLELANLLTDNSADEVDLRGTLSFTYDYITSTDHSEQAVLVLVTNGNSSTDESEIVKKLKAKGYKLLTVGTGDDIKPETLEKIASLSSVNTPQVPNFFSMSDDDMFSSFVTYLNDTYLYNGDITCCMTLRNPTHGKWDPPSCTQVPGSLKNSSCSMSCEVGYELVGNPSLICTEEGWLGPLGKGQIPLCNSAEVTTRSMFDSMDDTFAVFEKVGILFLLDHSTSMSAADYQKQISFVKMIVSKFSLSNSRTAGLITFNTQTQVMIPLNTHETCAFLMGLENVKFQGGGTSFSAALHAAENEINANAVHSTTLLFLMTDGRSHGNPRTIADRLKSDGNIIFTFGIGGYKRKQLESLASRGPNNRPNFFGVTDFDALKNAISFLNTSYLKPSEKHCCMRLRSQISGIWSPSHCSTFPSEEHDECSIMCDKGYELFGSKKLTCTAEGWSGVMASCFAKADIMANLIRDHIRNRLGSIKTPGALLFVLEQTERTLHEHFSIMTDFVKQIVSMFSLSKNQTAGLIVAYKTGVETEATLDTENTCDFIKYLNAAKFHKGSPSLGRALKLVKKTTKAYDLTDNTLIILLTDRKYISKISQSLARKLKDSGMPLFIIGIDNRDARSDLLIMSESGYFSNNTVPDDLIILDSYDTLEAVVDHLSMPEKLTAWYKTTGYDPPNC